MRLSALLRQHKLVKSELRWIEGDAFDRFRTCSFRLDDIPLNDPADAAVEMNQGRREGLLNAMRWLPGFVDERAHYSAAGHTATPTDIDVQATGEAEAGSNGQPGAQSNGATHDDRSWSRLSARSCQTGSSAVGEPSNRAGATLSTRPAIRIVRVGVLTRAQHGQLATAARPPPTTRLLTASPTSMSCSSCRPLRPTEGQGADGAGAVLGELRGRLGMGARTDRHVSITWAPENLDSRPQLEGRHPPSYRSLPGGR